MSVNTKSVKGRRTLRFATLAEAIADAEAIARADREGRLVRLGNWTAGMAFSHVAAFADFAFDGYPASLANPPWFIRLFLKLRKRAFLNNGLPAGVKIPGIPAGTVGADDVSTDEGLKRLRSALQRIDAQMPPKPNPVFGPLTHEEWKMVHLRHAELHFGYLVPK